MRGFEKQAYDLKCVGFGGGRVVKREKKNSYNDQFACLKRHSFIMASSWLFCI